MNKVNERTESRRFVTPGIYFVLQSRDSQNPVHVVRQAVLQAKRMGELTSDDTVILKFILSFKVGVVRIELTSRDPEPRIIPLDHTPLNLVILNLSIIIYKSQIRVSSRTSAPVV